MFVYIFQFSEFFCLNLSVNNYIYKKESGKRGGDYCDGLQNAVKVSDKK